LAERKNGDDAREIAIYLDPRVNFACIDALSCPGLCDATRQGEDPKAEAEKLLHESDDFIQSGQYQLALDKLQEALLLYQKAGVRRGRRRAYRYLVLSKTI